MKNRDLIENLKQYNLDADVTLTTSEDILLSYISEDNEGNKLTKEDTMLIFIEGCDEYMECAHEYMHETYDSRWCSLHDYECVDKRDCLYFEEFYE